MNSLFLPRPNQLQQLLSTQTTITDGNRQANHSLEQRSSRVRSPRVPQADESHTSDWLRSSIPPYEDLKAIFSGDTQWWNSWHKKTFGANTAFEELPRYLDRVYRTNKPVELGFVVSALIRQNTAETTSYLSILDRLLSDNKAVGCLDGLILTVFHAKVCLDIGQLHRAFLCNRRGISVAQLMVSILFILS